MLDPAYFEKKREQNYDFISNLNVASANGKHCNTSPLDKIQLIDTLVHY